MKPRYKPHTAAWRIWNIRYNINAPRRALYSDEYVKQLGYNVSGDKDIDRTTMKQLVPIKQTVAGMCLFLNSGHAFGLINHNDCIAIYEDIQEHLSDWRMAAMQGILPTAFPPIEELRIMEELAMEVYQTSMILQPSSDVGGHIFDQLRNLARRRNRKRFDDYERKRITDERDNLKPYVSIVDEIEQYCLENQ